MQSVVRDFQEVLPNHDLAKSYEFVKDYVSEAGFTDEITWQGNLHFENIEESDFLRESAWVILCAGMKESVIRRYFNNITFCFFEWESARQIVEMKKYCIQHALEVFNNSRKINAIAETAQRIADVGFFKLKNQLRNNPLDTIMSFPFMGPITSYHLAKNIGIAVAKADRHLARLAKALGYINVHQMCSNISEKSKDPIPVVDIVLWRFATLRKDYIKTVLQLSKV